jgi:hypothetical protein
VGGRTLVPSFVRVAKLTVWPPTGAAITPILSSVDNGWLAVGLRVVRGYVRELARRAGALYDTMDFGLYYRPDVNRILFHYAPSTGERYNVYGVDAIGMNPDGYPSNNDATLVDAGFPGCPGRDAKPAPPSSAYTNGVVTPHAAFLGLRWNHDAVLSNLERLRRDFDIYSDWGFADSVNVDTGVVSSFYLSLDQGTIMAAIGNELGNDVLRRSFVGPDLTQRVRPVIAVEEFSASSATR